MNPNIYRQDDPRWGSLPYPTASSPVSTDGCGLCAVTNATIELKKYWSATPKTFYSFMKQYAVSGNGTRWDGIDAGLKKYIGICKRFDDMASFWVEVSKSNRVGVILFRSGSAPDGTVYTSSGHYIAFVQYKYENGQHWLYLKDSSSYRHNDGWKSYERSMRGCIQFLWTAEIMKDGWYKENGYWYYYDNGTIVKSEWQKDSHGKWFYLGSDGKMVTSKWVKWKDEWYYLKDSGEMATNEWQKDSKGWCYLGSDGKMLKGKWVRWKNNMYYLDGDGHMVTGSRNVPCKFDDSGKLVTE